MNPIIDKDLSQLTSELNRVQEISTQTGIENRAKIMELEEINKDLSNKLSAVELKLSSMSDYETTKKDLSILRSLEFGDPEESEQRPLEVMILERSKALQVNNSNIIFIKNVAYFITVKLITCFQSSYKLLKLLLYNILV